MPSEKVGFIPLHGNVLLSHKNVLLKTKNDHGITMTAYLNFPGCKRQRNIAERSPNSRHEYHKGICRCRDVFCEYEICGSE